MARSGQLNEAKYRVDLTCEQISGTCSAIMQLFELYERSPEVVRLFDETGFGENRMAEINEIIQDLSSLSAGIPNFQNTTKDAIDLALATDNESEGGSN